MRVLVTGGAGYIGSVVVEELVRDGHDVVVYDSLYKGHREAVDEKATFVKGELLDGDLLRATLTGNRVEAVIHMAADSLVGESVTNPGKYYNNNVVAGLALLNAMVTSDVKKIVFSSTAAVYGDPEKQPIEETDPMQPTNPYGETKLAFEHALRWFENAYGIRYAALRYFNAAGATERCGEMHNPETHLIPLVLDVAAGKRKSITVYGDDYPTPDGTCIRDYIHVVDLARAHILALESLERQRSCMYNLGCGGDGYSVQQVIATAREVTGHAIPVEMGSRRAGDPAVLVASSEKIRRELGWKPTMGELRAIVQSAWTWMQSHPDSLSGDV
ncbi:MAG: UDP-glucose 4-epimerase GalE [Candidatus Kapaibacterium sp.]